MGEQAHNRRDNVASRVIVPPPSERNRAIALAVVSSPRRTLDSVGTEFGISRQRVSQILKGVDRAPR